MNSYHYCATRSLEIRLDPEVPPEVAQAIRPLLDKHMWLAPTFVHYVYVRWNADGEGGALSSTVLEEYRRMTLWVHGDWLSNTERGRDNDVRHEFLHGASQPLYRFGQKMIELHDLSDKEKQLLKEDLRVAVEKVTCDLQNMLDRMNAEPTP
jgi:hypothetical protein